MPNASFTAGQTIKVGRAVEPLQHIGGEHPAQCTRSPNGANASRTFVLGRAGAGDDQPPGALAEPGQRVREQR